MIARNHHPSNDLESAVQQSPFDVPDRVAVNAACRTVKDNARRRNGCDRFEYV